MRWSYILFIGTKSSKINIVIIAAVDIQHDLILCVSIICMDFSFQSMSTKLCVLLKDRACGRLTDLLYWCMQVVD